MKPYEIKEEPLGSRVVWAARTVFRELGPGLSREIYLNALAAELQRVGLLFEREKKFSIVYRGVTAGEIIGDVVVEDRLLVRVPEEAAPWELLVAGMESLLAAIGLPEGVLADFSGIHRRVVSFAA